VAQGHALHSLLLMTLSTSHALADVVSTFDTNAHPGFWEGDGSTPAISETSWNSFTVPLNASSWMVTNFSGAAATSAEFNSVLSSLTGLYTLGDFWMGVRGQRRDAGFGQRGSACSDDRGARGSCVRVQNRASGKLTPPNEL
jgi:hypothetical protein